MKDLILHVAAVAAGRAEPGPTSYRAVLVYACNLVHQYLWPLSRDETVIRFRVEGTPF